MVVKVHGHPSTVCTKRVLTVLEALNVPYELVLVDLLNGEQMSPGHKAHHPFGQVPYIEDDGFEVFESRAVCRYLALKYGLGGGGTPTPIPAQSDVERTARFEQAAHVELSNFDPTASKLAFEDVFKPVLLEQPRDTAAIEALKVTFEDKLDGYETMLSKTRFLGGDEISLVDLFHLSYGSHLKDQGLDYLESSKWPNVARWWNEVVDRPSWKKVNVSITDLKRS